MANNKRTIYLGLDYKDFAGGVTEINRKMGLLDAEFKLAKEQAKNYGNETDALAVKTDYLKQKIILQTQKVEAAKKAYDEAMSSQNASQKTIDALDKKLLQERTSLEKLNGELKDTTTQQEKANKATQSFGDAIRNVASELGVNVSPAVESFAHRFDGLNKSLGEAVIGVAALATGLVKASKKFAEYSDDVLTMSSVTGIATDDLQKFMYASELVDVSTDTLSSSLKKMIRSMDDARNGSGDAAEAFKTLGVRYKDANGQLKDSNDVFYATIDALGRIKNETERDALAMNIFGKSAMELNPLIKAGSGYLKELGDEAESTGKILNEDELKNGGALKDSMDKLENASSKLVICLGEALAPVLTVLGEALSKIDPKVLSIVVIFGSAAAIAVKLAGAFKALSVSTTVASGAQAAFGVTSAMSAGQIILLVAAVAALVGLFALLTGSANRSKEAIAEASEESKKLAAGVAGAQTGVQRHASGTKNFRGGRTWVGEEGPELVTLPSGSQITPADEVPGYGGDTYTINLNVKPSDVRDIAQVIELAKSQKSSMRRI